MEFCFIRFRMVPNHEVSLSLMNCNDLFIDNFSAKVNVFRLYNILWSIITMIRSTSTYNNHELS